MNNLTAFPCTFAPDEAWDPFFTEMLKPQWKYLPDNWENGLALPGPTSIDTNADCLALVEAVKLRNPDRTKAIEDQAESKLTAVWEVQKILGEPKAANRKMVGVLLREIQAPIFILKLRFNRGRPWQCCAQNLDPMFRRPSDYHPAHPAYPSGHATMAYALAYVMAEIIPAKSVDFLRAAECVAFNREVAGLHYRSDSEAGRLLAKHLVDQLLLVSKFSALVRATCAEWGSKSTFCVKQP